MLNFCCFKPLFAHLKSLILSYILNIMKPDKITQWQKLGFGMFIHYGLYSLCGGVWKGEPVKRGYSEQILSHGKIPKEEYKALQNKFTCKNFDAEKICALAKAAGMKYIIITAKHHDGFCLFDTKTTGYNSVKAPAKRDLIAELSQACKKNGLRFGLYFSWIDWNCEFALPISDHNSDKIPPKHQKFNIEQLKELFTNYGPLCELWMDMGYPTKKQSEEVRALAQKLQPNMMINGRIWNDCGDFCTMGDNKFPDKSLNVPWQTPASIYHETWGYRSWQRRGNKNKKAQELIESLIRVRAMGGNYLLNIGPKGDGSVVAFEAEVLKKIGSFFKSKTPSQGCAKKLCKKLNLDLPQDSILELSGEKNEIPFTKKLYRFTGKDYYSSHFICTELELNLKTSKDLHKTNFWTISLARKKPLSQDEVLEINGKEFCFPANKKELEIFKNIKIESVLKISVSTGGTPSLRKALKQDNLILRVEGK